MSTHFLGSEQWQARNVEGARLTFFQVPEKGTDRRDVSSAGRVLNVQPYLMKRKKRWELEGRKCARGLTKNSPRLWEGKGWACLEVCFPVLGRGRGTGLIVLLSCEEKGCVNCTLGTRVVGGVAGVLPELERS